MADLPFVIVPKVPTDEMIAAGTPANQHTEWPAEVVYAEMLDASPPPVSLEEIVEVLETALNWMPIGFASTSRPGSAGDHNARVDAAREKVRSLLARLEKAE